MRKSILLSVLFALFSVLVVSAAEPWQFSFSKETSTCFKNKGVYSQFISPVCEIDEPTDVLRLTVFATRNTDKNTGTRAEGFSNSAPAFPTFVMSEIRVYDGAGNLIELNEEDFETNAYSSDEGATAYLVDNDINSYFHSTYSRGEAPQAYHYIDIFLPEEVDKFRVEFDGRHYFYYTDPTFVAITAGTEALPWVEDKFVLGEQVTDVEALQPNTFYAIKGGEWEYTPGENDRYNPYTGEAFYHSPLGAALTPSMASVFYLEDAGDGKYRMRWLKNNRYVAKGGNIDGSANTNWHDDARQAAAMTFLPSEAVDGAFEIREGNLHLGQRRYVRMAWVNNAYLDRENTVYSYAWNVYKVDFNNTAIVPVLQASIDKAEALIEEQSAIDFGGEDEFIATAVSAAKKMVVNASASAKEMFDQNVQLSSAINEYRSLYLYTILDSITNILSGDDLFFCNSETGWQPGGFPEEYKEMLEKYIDEATIAAETSENYDDVNFYIGKLSESLEAFWASRVDKVTSFPIIITEDCGLRDNLKDNIYYWTSPVYYLDEPTDVIRMTVFKNTSGETEPDYNVGTPFFCLGEFILYDGSGNQIELREDMFSTNSLQVGDGYGLAGLCDGDHRTFYHGCYAPNPDNGSYAPENAANGEYCYIEVALDEEISAFSYGLVGREYPYDYYMHLPLYFAFTKAQDITKDQADVLLEDVVDEYEVVLGEKVMSADELVSGEIYALLGNLNVKNGDEPTGFYGSFNSVAGKSVDKTCAFVFEKAEDGGFYMRHIGSDAYIKAPTHWAGVSTTYFNDESCSFVIEPSANLAEAFKIYYPGMVTLPDTATRHYGEEVNFMLQDWGSYMGLYPVKDFSEDDTDGESDWCIYRISMQRRGNYELKAVKAAIDALGVDPAYVGDAVGMYSGNGVAELLDAVSKAQALWESKDDVACQVAAAQLQKLLQTSVRSLEMNELVSGRDYVIRSANEEFIPYHGDAKFAMYVGPTNHQDTQRDNETMLWWTYEYVYGLDSTAYHFTFVEDTVRLEGDATEAGWGKYIIKNVFADQYIVPEQGSGKNLVVGEYSEADAPRIYVAPGEKPGFRRMVGADAWRTGDNIYSYFEVRTGGGGYGTGGEAHYGHVAQWYFLANTAQWKLIPVSKTTSINDIIIDEPCGEVVSETYYTTAGVAIPVPAKGVNIVRKVYANGVIETKKIFVK